MNTDRASLEIEFQESEWEGCTHLDCLEGCSHSAGSWRCMQFERAFEAWASSRSPADCGGARE